MELTEELNNQVLVYDEAAFEVLFKDHFKALHAYATVMLKDEEMAEEIVQQLFLKLWEKRERLQIDTSIKAYLYRAVYHDSLNYLKHLKVRKVHEDHTSYQMRDAAYEPSKNLETRELELRLDEALKELPEQCRTIFQMSRFEELKYREIAERLQIAPKTVENQMGKALRILREKLADYLPLILVLMLLNRSTNH